MNHIADHGESEVPTLHRAEAPTITDNQQETAPLLHIATSVTIMAVGLILMTLRSVKGPVGDWLSRWACFAALPEATQLHVDDLLLVPAASVAVVFCRVALGLRMLGPFRPILIALAFYQTGVLAGSVFIAAVLVIVAGLRPGLSNGLLPYFGRLSVLLSCVVLIELIALLLGHHLQSEHVLQAAVFPIVVLCLSADGFARVLSKSGLRPAVWRGCVTIGIAAAITTIGEIDEVADFLMKYPEFILVEIALIMTISTRMKWGLLEAIQPKES